jgi:hypothetical protein
VIANQSFERVACWSAICFLSATGFSSKTFLCAAILDFTTEVFWAFSASISALAVVLFILHLLQARRYSFRQQAAERLDEHAISADGEFTNLQTLANE